MNQNQLLQIGKEILRKENIEDYEVKSKRLLEFVLKQSREEFIKNSLQESSKLQEKEYREKLEEVIHGKPLQYITNNQEFMGLNFYVDENVLIPQPDTEVLVEEALKMISKIKEIKLSKEKLMIDERCIENKVKKNVIQVLDLCTGSGAIAISISKYAEKVQMTAVDISSKALDVARKNATQNKVEDKIQLIESDLFDKIPENKFDMIVSNPPYIETNEISNLSLEVKKEPFIALDGGEDGLDFYKAILEKSDNYLKQKGYLLSRNYKKRITNYSKNEILSKW